MYRYAYELLTPTTVKVTDVVEGGSQIYDEKMLTDFLTVAANTRHLFISEDAYKGFISKFEVGLRVLRGESIT